FDGLIFDSETHEFATVCELFTEHGVELTLEVWSQCVGREAGFFDPYAHLEELTGRPLDRAALAGVRRRRFQERILAEGPIPGVEEALRTARSLGLRVGLASSSTRRWVQGQLERLGLLEYFDCIRTSDDVERAKPEPDLYLSVLECLGVPPQRAVALEDSPNGALAARRAGLYCVVVPNPVTARLEFGEHDLRLDSLLQAGLAEVLARVVASRGAAAPSPSSGEQQ
ncbi:MAG TPA: HAD family hydrolase, partial [Longimicrobiaceae bacterium]|nr:HAD family hydrolase [Longimicrobiaceae bacterium]